MTEIFTYRKRKVTTDDVEFIRSLIAEQPTIGRCELSRQVCRAWNWIQPNGYLKDIVCRGLMLKLERGGDISPFLQENSHQTTRLPDENRRK